MPVTRLRAAADNLSKLKSISWVTCLIEGDGARAKKRRQLCGVGRIGVPGIVCGGLIETLNVGLILVMSVGG